MNILILGSGGREHALAWAVRQNPKCNRLLIAPGNAGTVAEGTPLALDICDCEAILALVREYEIDFVIIGPEAPLVAGVADSLRAAGILCFGPDKAAAELENSKAFTKKICDIAGIPTAPYRVFDEKEAALAYLQAKGAPIVIKADGLAAGKGVSVAFDIEAALRAVEDIFAGSFGDGQKLVVIEGFMSGEEASLFVLANGEECLPIGTAQDHKRAFDGDLGPNTGGMGAYSPAPIMSDALVEQAMEKIIKPTLKALAERGTPYQGVLYAGLMIEKSQVRLVEYNVRFGDPECQVLMMRLGAQALDLMQATALDCLQDIAVHWAEDHALTVVMAAKGYPGAYEKGEEIKGLETLPRDSQQMCFNAGTRRDGTRVLSAGGRVLNLSARAETLKEAREKAYAMAAKIDWAGGFYRSDIGWRALKDARD